MKNFEYTEIFDDFKSSFIEGVYYNENTQKVALDLKGMVYVYDGIMREDVVKLASAPSVGAEYSNFAERFGPAEFIGEWSFNLFVEVKSDKQEEKPKLDALINNTSTFTGTISSSINTNSTTWIAKPHRQHEIFFTLDGLDEEKTYSVSARDNDEAIAALRNLLDSVGLKFKVKKVVSYY